jgi:hypothetical protein
VDKPVRERERIKAGSRQAVFLAVAGKGAVEPLLAYPVITVLARLTVSYFYAVGSTYSWNCAAETGPSVRYSAKIAITQAKLPDRSSATSGVLAACS